MLPVLTELVFIYELRAMNYQLIDGKKVSLQIQEEISVEVKAFVSKGGKTPHLAAVLVGNDGGSETYVASKIKTCEKVGFKSTLIRHDSTVSEIELLRTVDKLNTDPDIDGFIVQLPLPKHINEQKIIEAVNPEKDVDGFHPINVGRMVLNLPAYISATPYGIVQLLKSYTIETSGKHCVVIGRSNIVGSPMSILMAKNSVPGNCTVTLCHSKTKDIKSFTLAADIIICALGKPEFLTADMVKQGAIVIDVGTTRVQSTETKSGFKLKGDVKFDEVAPKCSYITPVPGGVGPMTIASLLKNTLLAAKREIYK
jgi:methylenetetrahydrofolate dehydrogenase (NADP+) / methenyltetrahydrofolate cyclohydrolase